MLPLLIITIYWILPFWCHRIHQNGIELTKGVFLMSTNNIQNMTLDISLDEMQEIIDSLENKLYRKVKLIDGLRCTAGQILTYTPNGYMLADNSSEDKCRNIVLAFENSVEGEVKTIDSGTFNTYDTSHDGDQVFVGKNGAYVFAEPTAPGEVNQLIGYMEKGKLIFSNSYPQLVNYDMDEIV